MMLKKILLFFCSFVTISAFCMERSLVPAPEKLGNPWAELPENNAQIDPVAVELFAAIALQDIDFVRNHLVQNPSLKEVRNPYGHTPLHFAASFENVNVVRALLDSGAQVNADSPVGTPLHMAASEGVIPVIELLLERGANIHARDQWGRTPLYDAIYDLHYDVIALLLKHGAARCQSDLSADVLQDNMGRTPLHIAVIRWNEVVYYQNKCKKDPVAALQNPDKYLMRFLVLQHEKKSIAQLLFTQLQDRAEQKDRLGKTAYEYQTLAKVMPLTKCMLEKVKSSFAPELLKKKSPARKSPGKKNKNKSTPRVVKKIATSDKVSFCVEHKEIPVLPTEKAEEVQAVEKESNLEQRAPSIELYSGYTPALFDTRVLAWFNNSSLASLLTAGSSWWGSIAKRKELLYHQIPFAVIDHVMEFGVRELRERAKTRRKDISWRMHGCMEFDVGIHNPWCLGKTKQEGFYHCTKGQDGKIYHIGFDPVQDGAFLSAYFPQEFMQETIKTKLYDSEKGITYKLYA